MRAIDRMPSPGSSLLAIVLVASALAACSDAAGGDGAGGAAAVGASAGMAGAAPVAGGAATVALPPATPLDAGGVAGAAGSSVPDAGATGDGGPASGASDAGLAALDAAVTAAPTGDAVCASAAEGDVALLTCPDGQIVDRVTFASYGDPTGDCGGVVTGVCDAAGAVDAVEALCLGRARCSVPATNGSFGDPCSGTAKRLVVEVGCVVGEAPDPLPFKGVANSPCAAREALGVSWYYNWMQNETEPCAGDSGGEFVPMIWGHPGDEQSASAIAGLVRGFADAGHAFVLGFNEPDNPSQSNIPVATAIQLWPAFDDARLQVGSPGTAANANPGQAWFSDFMGQLEADPSLRADFLAIHWYGWNAGSCDPEAAQLEAYIGWAEAFAGNRPLWITEWGCLNQSAPDEATVIAFYEGALRVFDRHPRVERYAWYPWSTNCNLNAGDGSLTALGQVYAAAPSNR